MPSRMIDLAGAAGCHTYSVNEQLEAWERDVEAFLPSSPEPVGYARKIEKTCDNRLHFLLRILVKGQLQQNCGRPFFVKSKARRDFELAQTNFKGNREAWSLF